MGKMRAFPGPIRQEGPSVPPRYVLSDEQKEWIREYFPSRTALEMYTAMGVAPSTFYRFLREMGIRKTSAQQARIWRANSRKGVRKLRANGYYDSLRDKGVSQACRDGIKAYWQDIKDGKRPHPLEVMKKKHPRLYAKRSARNSENRKKLLRMERFRLMSGLRQETNLHVVVTPFTRSQVLHRHNALARGYWFYDDCSEAGGERYNIYYDADTKRSARFEMNLEKDGFNVKDGTGL